MNNNHKLLAAAFVLVFVGGVFMTPVNAQATMGFGTQVKLGDVDFRPTAVAAQTVIGIQDTAAQQIKMVDFGITGDVNDNCVYYDVALGGLNPANFDVRLTPCQGHAAGTFVTDADTVEKSTAFFVYAATTDSVVRFADVNNNGRYDAGDCLFAIVQTEAGVATNPAGILASTGNNVFTVRLTACGTKAAGTLVFASDSDFTSYSGATTVVASATSGVAFFDADNTATVTTGDSLYYVPVAVVAGSLFPQFSVRLVGGSGAFGTQVKLGDSDFVPIAQGANVAITGGAFGTAGRIFGVDFGITAQVTDDCFYYRQSATATAAPINFDVRLTPCQGKAAGTLVTDADTVEKSSVGQVSPALTVKYADVNNNGRYDVGDCVFVGSGAATVLVASTTSNPGPGAWTIRLTGCGSYAAGTLVFASDTDFTSYNAAVKQTGWAGFGVQFFDADNTATITTGDLVYFSPQATGAGVVFPQYSLRLVGGSGAFGSQIKLGDADFVPTLITTAAVTLVAGDSEVDFGVTAQVTDNCFYYNSVAPNTALSNFDVRLVDCQGAKAGSMLSDTSTVEKSTASIDAGAATVTFADVNNNGRYDWGDCVFYTTGGANTLAASTGNAAWSIRLTACGSMAAGTLVFASDSDFTSYRTASPALGPGTGVIAYFDADNTATITTGDVVYVIPTAALGAPPLVPLYSVRLSGTPTASGPSPGGTSGPAVTTTTSAAPVTTTTTPAPVMTTTTTPAPVMTTTTTSNAGGNNGSGSGSGNNGSGSTSPPTTPGFELVALVGALGAALILVRRKL